MRGANSYSKLAEERAHTPKKDETATKEEHITRSGQDVGKKKTLIRQRGIASLC